MARSPRKGCRRQRPGSRKPMHAQIWLRVDRRELATILAALRFHRDENLQGDGGIPDKVIQRIASHGDRLVPLSFEEVGRLCTRLSRNLRGSVGPDCGKGGHR